MRNQNPYIEEEQTTQWPKEKGQKDKQRSIKLQLTTLKENILTLPKVSTSATGNGSLFVDASLAYSKSTSINNNIHKFIHSNTQ